MRIYKSLDRCDGMFVQQLEQEYSRVLFNESVKFSVLSENHSLRVF